MFFGRPVESFSIVTTDERENDSRIENPSNSWRINHKCQRKITVFQPLP